MKNSILKYCLGAFFFSSFFLCNFAGTFFNKSVQSVYLEDNLTSVGKELEAYWVNKPGFSFKDAEWSLSDDTMAELMVSEDNSKVTIKALKEGSVLVYLKHGDEVVDTVELFFVNDSVSEDMVVSANVVSEVSISDFIKISDPQKLKWKSSDESIISLEGTQRKYDVKPKRVGEVILTAYYGDTVIGDINVKVKGKEKLPKDCVLSEEGIKYLDTDYMYSNLNPEVVYSFGKIDAGTVLGVSNGELKIKKGRHFKKSDVECNLPSYYMASREGKEVVKVKVKDKEYKVKVKVVGTEMGTAYNDWKKEWLKGIDMNASVMDKVKAIARVTSNLKFEPRSWKKELVVSGGVNSLGASSLFTDLCEEVGVESYIVKVNYDKFGKDLFELAENSSILNYSVCKFKDGDIEYIVDVTPKEDKKNSCYYLTGALLGIYNNLWEGSDL